MTVYIVMQTDPIADICAVYTNEHSAEEAKDRLEDTSHDLEVRLGCDPCYYEVVPFEVEEA